MEHSFLQSHEWERLQEALGRKAWRVGRHLVIRHDLSRGFNYLYAPHLIGADGGFWDGVRMIARDERSLFLKVEPKGPIDELVAGVAGWRSSHSLQPQKTVIIDLTKSEEGLLSAMHQKMRYNIRLAERHGVSVVRGNPENAKYLANTFWDLLMETSERDVFHLHPKPYYEKLLTVGGDASLNKIYCAEYRGTVLAAALVNFYEKTATYLHGASTIIHKEVMAPHYLHWRIMQDAKKMGMTAYDLWGIDEERWPGVTRFKMGFGGTVVEYPRAVDMVFRPGWYAAYTTMRKIF
ncbi:MAG: hypothetical protein A3I44_04780 [Candidatus Sungbacteria bacterium RIFCSPLOWO2_02_FULL_51_17]|uniref:BioF2-like acetyltransferase domain-containing protein n=1 Tax=Candidatus Sungbacteria bacterium RIFCSPHIGHO2_02_FULL_51_29 TaxID=1802273 RepID=A0A1G2KS56_9BACT|nr:MAG: hypothetical protein A2676_01590 [Candidatus Sungbacteria bacterium RIFCSPHIGHO2_01_FULL_51_22]OHA01239.1 MAG: hypothetical protein A3C16_02820 [Candidatus Sungbacteria bacterium RIFCSPHIGHO2_02_FULL_51_29]OHA05864.1 MAG: hypothetical protein A3B29_01850 [Candidatus Sungbacteria bacterium RIFCSPLOWO2_01_FULL_51_34]OHA11348.1 MAG: hypothetical protein A3I44_04780 [Candidatus Sungbacteria bacterium RIFCSPLOWO2_02_FULL_51_17]